MQNGNYLAEKKKNPENFIEENRYKDDRQPRNSSVAMFFAVPHYK